MPPSISLTRVAAVLGGFLALASCTRDLSTLGPAPFPSDAPVFADGFAPGVNFQAFAGSKLDAITIDGTTRRTGAAALRVVVPGPGDPTGGYAGGAFVATVPRDLTGYNALTFWARSSIPAALNTFGLGNDNTGTSRYTAEGSALALTPAWKKFVVPIPLPAKLTRERGLFFFAEGAENGAGYELWFDEIQFETVNTIRNPRPAIATRTINTEIGATVQVTGTAVTFEVGGADLTIGAAPSYFTYTSTNPSVATVGENGVITVVGAGETVVRASLGSQEAAGAVTVRASAPPAVAAPSPTRPAADVISLFSGVYTNRPVDTWSAVWDQADVSDVKIAGDDVKKYSNLVFAGVEFTSNPVDAGAMTHIHLDVWTQDASRFSVKLVDFGANGVFGGGDDTEHEVTLSAGSTPPLTTGAWSSLDIPLAAFTGLAARRHLAQMVLAAASPTVYIDNVYFFKAPAPTAPTVAAPTPTRPAGSVISLFSNAYPNAPVDTWSAAWDNADVADVQIAGNDAKKYTNLSFAGIEFVSQPIDASGMTGFHMDLWTPDPTAAPAAFRIKLVDFGANGAFGGGDDVEHEITLTAATTPALATREWVGIDVPLSAFTGLTTRGHLAQMVISGDPNTVFIDNVYFYSAAPAAPTVAAPTPTFPAGDVISLFSNAYPNVTVDTWSAPWDNADVADVQVAGNDTKKYTNLVFAGIEFTSAPINATAMTHFSLDFWTPDPTAPPAVFRIKLVDFGANGTFGGGDDVEHELTFTATSTPALMTGAWVRFDIPLSAFTGLTTRAHLAQLIIVADPNTVYVDNVLLHR